MNLVMLMLFLSALIRAICSATYCWNSALLTNSPLSKSFCISTETSETPSPLLSSLFFSFFIKCFLTSTWTTAPLSVHLGPIHFQQLPSSLCNSYHMVSSSPNNSFMPECNTRLTGRLFLGRMCFFWVRYSDLSHLPCFSKALDSQSKLLKVYLIFTSFS